MRQRLVRAVGGTIKLVPPEAKLFGVPSAGPTVTIKLSSGADLVTPVVGAAATLDTFNSALTQAAAAGDRKIVVGSTAGLARYARYLVTCADGELVQVRVANFDGGGNVFLAGSLPRALSNGDTLKGIELSYAVTAGNAQSPSLGYQPWPLVGDYMPTTGGPKPVNLALFRASWSYAIGGVAYLSDTLYEVNARLLKSTLQPDEIAPYLPDEWSHLVRLDDTSQLEITLEDAWLEVLDDLTIRGYKPDRVMDPDRLRQSHLNKALELLGMTWGKAYADWAEKKRSIYTAKLNAALSDGDWYDASDDAMQQQNETQYTSIKFSR